MLLKLAALGTLGYVGYKYVQKNGGVEGLTDSLNSLLSSGSRNRATHDSEVELAGGPLSDNATLVSGGDPLPA